MRFPRHRAPDPDPDPDIDPDIDTDTDTGRTGGADAGAPIGIDIGSATATAARADNQDRAVVTPGLAVVSDGMGGYRGGAHAAELSVAAVHAALVELAFGGASAREVSEAFDRANEAVRHARAADPATGEMGATLTVALATSPPPGPSRWLIGHVGDSPAFLVTADDTIAVTTDHTPAAELVAAGVLTAEEAARHPARHLLSRAIGPDPTVAVDITEVVLRASEALVLGSDGLSGSVDATGIGAIVRSAPTAATAASELVRIALERGATDNVTAVVVRQLPSSSG